MSVIPLTLDTEFTLFILKHTDHTFAKSPLGPEELSVALRDTHLSSEGVSNVAEADLLTRDWRGWDGVHHVEIPATGDVIGHLPHGMSVFWWHDRPIAHTFVESAEAPGTASRIGADVFAAIASEERDASAPRYSASVVICTRDRATELQRCLASLPQQTYPAHEIIVVDNASRDVRVRDVVLEAGAIYLREDRAGLDVARNTGARRATSDIVVYTDDDVLLHPQWLERLVAAFDRPAIASVMGLVLPAELATDAQRHFETFWSFGRGYIRSDYTAQHFAEHRNGVFPAWQIGAGASMAFRRDIFERVGWFDERLDVGQAGCSGDSEFWYRVLANGFDCRYEPRAVAFHFHRRTLDGLASQIFHYMRGHSAALMVQFERTGLSANRTQALWRMPRWYLGRVWRRLRSGATPRDRFLKEEITGYLSGLAFYWRNRRMAR